MHGHGPSPPPLGVYATVGEAFRLTFRNFRTMLGLALLPMALAVLLPAVMRLDLQDTASGALLIIHAVARLFLLSVFAVAWHRYLLLGTRDTTLAVQFWPGSRDLRYFGRITLFLLPQEIILVAIQAQNLVLVLLLLLATLFVAAPFALVFPATALDAYRGFAAARRTLRGATLQLIGAILLSFVAIAVLLFLLGGLFGPLVLVNFGPGAMVSFFNALTFLTVGVPVAVVSVAYRDLGGPGCAPRSAIASPRPS